MQWMFFIDPIRRGASLNAVPDVFFHTIIPC